MQDVKQSFIEALYNRGCYIKKVNNAEYRTRCPFCGDSQKDPHTGHLYIRINIEDNFPMVYHCFKCNESGIVNSDFLETIGFDDKDLKAGLVRYNKNSDNMSSHKFLYGDKVIQFGYEIPEIEIGHKTKYICDRLGINFTMDEFKKMKVITSLRDFLIKNEIKELMMDDSWLRILEKNYVGFLSFGASHIFFRDTVDKKSKYPWVKYPITKKSNECKALYSMEALIDIYTKDNIIINLSEGVFDILSVYGNLEYKNPNTMNIAVGGKGYLSILSLLTNMGLVGDNITVNIFADNDDDFNKKGRGNTDIKYFDFIFKKRKELYGSVNVYYNTISKDLGVPKDQIKIKKYRL